MTTIAVSASGFTRLPACTSRSPVRPSIGARIARVFEIQSRGLYRGFVRLHRGRQRSGGGLHLIVLLPRSDALPEQRRVAALVGRGLPVLRAILGEIRLRLTQRGVERPRVDREQQVALLDVLPLAEMHLHDLAADLRLHVHGRESLDPAYRANRIGDSFLFDLGREDRHRIALAESIGGTMRTSSESQSLRSPGRDLSRTVASR